MEAVEQGLHSAMNLVLRYCISIAICAVTTALAQSPTPILSGSDVSRLLGYPEKRIQIRDLTEAAKIELPQAILAMEYYSDDGTFAPFLISVAPEKSILTPELLQGTDRYLQKAQAQGTTPSVRKIDLGGGIKGIAGLGGFGPGATEERIIVSVPNRMDVLIKMTIPGDGLTVASDTKAYHRLITEGGERLAETLIECVKVTVAAAASMPSLAAQQPQQARAPVLASTPNYAALAPPSSPTGSTPKPSPDVQINQPQQSSPWPWIIGAILFLAVMGGVWFKFLRK